MKQVIAVILPNRKSTRIPNYNYSSHNYYFVTICTAEKKCIFGNPERINEFGRIVGDCIQCIPNIYPQATVDKWVVMPNHVHMILVIGNGRDVGLPDLTRVIGQLKMAVTKRIRRLDPDIIVWQRSFYDHIIRDEKSYQKIWEYIENNPLKWKEDCFYRT